MPSNLSSLFLLTFIPLLVGCGSRYTVEYQHQSPNLEIGLAAPSSPEDAPVFDHPNRFLPGELDRLLASIHYIIPKLFSWSNPITAFNEDDREHLTPYLQRAFANATRHEKIVFSIRTRMRAAYGSRSGMTRGELTIQDGYLHLNLFSLAGQGMSSSSGPIEGQSDKKYTHWRLSPQPRQHLIGKRLNRLSIPIRVGTYGGRLRTDEKVEEEKKLFDSLAR